MDNSGNITTLYEDDNLVYPIKLVLYEKNTIEENIANRSVWATEKCVETFFLNDTLQNNITQWVFLYNGTNITCLPHAPVLTKNTIIRVSVLFGIAMLSFLGNLATIISVHRGKKGRGRARLSWTAIYSLIFQLSIADLLVTVFCLAGEAAWSLTVEWYGGNIGCKVFKFLQMFSLYLSTFVLVLIGVDRWLAVKYPMRSMDTATRSRTLVIVVWVLSIVLSVPQVIIFSVVRGPFFEEFYQCVTHGFYTEPWQEPTYTILTFLVMFILPLVILVSTYVSTVRTIAQSQNLFQPEVRRQEMNHCTPDMKPIDTRNEKLHRAKIKSLRMSVVIVAAFLIWWTPYYVMMMIFMFWNPDKELTEELRNGIFFFGMSNSLVNPVIYGAFHLWTRKKAYKRNDRESVSLHASFLRRDEINTSSMRLTLRYSTKYSNVHNVSLL